MNTSLLIICSDEKNDVSSPQSRYLKKKKNYRQGMQHNLSLPSKFSVAPHLAFKHEGKFFA